MQGRQLLALALTAWAATGCGYQLVRYGGSLGDVASLAIPTLRNDSYEPGVEVVVSDALRREFLRRGAVRLLQRPGDADLVLSGSVESVEISGEAFSSVLQALEYEVHLALRLEAVRRDGRPVPMDARSLRESERYLASADLEAERKNREEAVRRVAGLLAGRVHDALAEALRP